ncbi:Relaxase/mobilization nuclease family protein, partial [mine drainage metagenome]
MLIKFLGHGTGNAHAAARYLTGTHDHNGIERVEVKVLRGDPMQVAQVADSLEFKNRYTSGVIAFAPEDNPTDEQIKQVLDDLERTAFAGLSPDRVAYSAILHREDNGACHIHIFVARVDLI